MKRKLGVALCVLGVLLAIFGVVWIAAIWPRLSKMPGDLDTETIQEGTVSLYNAGSGGRVTHDVASSRHYVARNASEDIVYLDETITFTNTATGETIHDLDAKYLVAVDRVTRQNVAGRGDGIGGGYFSFPFNVSKDKVYPWWNEGNPENLDCKYVDETDFEGLHVYIFEMSTPEEGLVTPASFDTPDMRVDQKITMYVEPASGVTVYFESTTKRSGVVPVQDELFPNSAPVTHLNVTFYEDELKFTQGTTDDLVAQAKSARTQIVLAKNLLPWLSIGCGVVLVAMGIFLARKAGRVASLPESEETRGQ